MKLLDLDTMQFVQEKEENKVIKIIGQKLFIATRKGVKLLLHRLLKGKQDYFDTSMCQLIRAHWLGVGRTTLWWMVANGRRKKCQNKGSWRQN